MSLRHTLLSSPRRLAGEALSVRHYHTQRASYATLTDINTPQGPGPEDTEPLQNDFIMSILQANPSLRDAKSYLASFGPRPQVLPKTLDDKPDIFNNLSIPLKLAESLAAEKQSPDVTQSPQKALVASILNPIQRRTALVKIQCPFTDVQLESIARGMVYLEKLGLVSVIVVEHDRLVKGDVGERATLVEETMRVVTTLEKQGAKARPILGAVVRLGPKPGEEGPEDVAPPEAHTLPSDLVPIRSALRAGEIPVLPPFALDSFCRSSRVHANDVIAALARGMVEAAALDNSKLNNAVEPSSDSMEDIDLVPLRLMIINREGGIPSYARSGYPHLLVNVTSEYSYIHDTFHDSWLETHPTALSNLALARTCLTYMPPTSSAIMVSHRSPSSLIGNLITNKPAVSSSLPHALLQGNRKLTPATPTLLRRGQPVRVIRRFEDIDRSRIKNLLEQSFGRTLNEAFFERLKRSLDFIIVAGDYAGAAIVTNEHNPYSPGTPISYLDKFAVLPSHQGDGTVDFLWVALHDESYGLGASFSANPNGGKQGQGEGRDLVWRSRANNPINKWYFERSTGHFRMGDWILFWCDAEKRLQIESGRRANAGLSFVEGWEDGRLSQWTRLIPKIPSSWQ